MIPMLSDTADVLPQILAIFASSIITISSNVFPACSVYIMARMQLPFSAILNSSCPETMQLVPAGVVLLYSDTSCESIAGIGDRE
ncbi:hypothetical protein V6N13_084396 [Hibiscus sabdariffa]